LWLDLFGLPLLLNSPLEECCGLMAISENFGKFILWFVGLCFLCETHTHTPLFRSSNGFRWSFHALLEALQSFNFRRVKESRHTFEVSEKLSCRTYQKTIWTFIVPFLEINFTGYFVLIFSKFCAKMFMFSIESLFICFLLLVQFVSRTFKQILNHRLGNFIIDAVKRTFWSFGRVCVWWWWKWDSDWFALAPHGKIDGWVFLSLTLIPIHPPVSRCWHRNSKS
jgi:hypothetical protein